MNPIEYEYEALLKSGMFWEFFPQLSGEWEKDEEEFTEFYINRENKAKNE